MLVNVKYMYSLQFATSAAAPLFEHIAAAVQPTVAGHSTQKARNQDSLQVVEFPDVEGPLEFQYDEEWLGVLQATHYLMSLNRQQAPLPGKRTLLNLSRLVTAKHACPCTHAISPPKGPT